MDSNDATTFIIESEAPYDGVVTELRARIGDQVKVDQLLAVVKPS